jgi:light-harvesting protein B-800-850 alpha chain
MIYGKIWLHVKPSVGIPLFLGAVAVASFSVHVALVTNTTWVKRFLNGWNATKTAQVEQDVAQANVPPPTVVLTASTTRGSD